MTPEQAQEIADKLDEALALLRKVKALLEGERSPTMSEWHRDTAPPPYLFDEGDAAGHGVSTTGNSL